MCSDARSQQSRGRHHSDTNVHKPHGGPPPVLGRRLAAGSPPVMQPHSALQLHTIRASSAVAPWPLACTISGLTSISASSGTVCISRPIAITALRDRLDVRRRCAADAGQKLGRAQLAQRLDDLRLVSVSGQQLHVAQRLDPDAAKAQQQDRAPTGIALGADHQLDASRRHLFDQDAVELHIGRGALDACHHRVPRGAQRGLVGEIQHDAAGLGLVRQRRGLRLQRHRIADALCHRSRLVRGARKLSLGHAHASGLEHLLAEPFGLRALAALRQALERLCRRTRAAAREQAAVAGVERDRPQHAIRRARKHRRAFADGLHDIGSKLPGVAERHHDHGLGRVRHALVEGLHHRGVADRKRDEQHADIGIVDQRLDHDRQRVRREAGGDVERIAVIAVRRAAPR